jgi:hypothetical protein
MTEHGDPEVMEFANLREVDVQPNPRVRLHEQRLEAPGCEAIEDAFQPYH